jgi:hypothetical protein
VQSPVFVPSHLVLNWEETSSVLSLESRLAIPERQLPLPISVIRRRSGLGAESLRKPAYHMSGDIMAQLSKLTGPGKQLMRLFELCSSHYFGSDQVLIC